MPYGAPPRPLPPLEEQRRIVARLEPVQEKLETLKNAQAATDAELERPHKSVLRRSRRSSANGQVLQGGLKARPPKPPRAANGRFGRGLRTAEEAFRRPILHALVELGGSAPVGEVLEKVGAKLKSGLNQCDCEPVPSDPRSVPWKKSAPWWRNTLVREGLMKRDSPHSLWKISDPRRSWLVQESTS